MGGGGGGGGRATFVRSELADRPPCVTLTTTSQPAASIQGPLYLPHSSSYLVSIHIISRRRHSLPSMVCKKCEKKISKAAAPDPFRNRNSAGFLVSSGSGSGSSSAAGPSRGPGAGLADGGRKVGENKLLSKANRYNPIGTKCKVCKQTVSQDRATYCQGE